ncbi:flavin reductase family protein [Nocardioides daeguensis]|uniref:Flavin reductase like domain-containing protein n=1 Tax=Nocardioides daeguensis TaxID=908359 RepID=A0ABP6UTY8_9ACTN|nr:flavin reductase [Nocardioides daeguensis]MBV6725733.1 flavin reductase family protein [Nocardioides daeguensis]MCR1772752.1 flavin reductase family protein [Nocardioides daeguensis]
MTIHSTHPFADADPDPARRFRGRVGGAVTLWTAGDDHDRAGLTVTSLMVALGPEPAVLALLDPDSDLLAALRDSGRGVVQLLSWADRQLAEAFAGTAPAPGGPFRQATFVTESSGPRLATATTWAGVRLAGEREVGWSVEVTAVLEHVVVGDDRDPLLHRRGRYLRLP